MTTRIRLALVAALPSVALAASSAVQRPYAGLRFQPDVATPTAVTFSEHVAPIIFDNCTSCHRPTAIGPLPQFDANQDGKIELDEISSRWRRRMAVKLDKNSDGAIDKNELADAQEKYANQGRDLFRRR